MAYDPTAVGEDGRPARIEGSWRYKFITVARLQALLAQLDPADELVPNRVGNLAIYRPAEEGFIFYGAVDIGPEEIEVYGEVEDEQ